MSSVGPLFVFIYICWESMESSYLRNKMLSNISYDLISPIFYDDKIDVLHQNVSSPFPTLVPSPVRQTSLTYNALVDYAEILRLPLVAIFILSIPFIVNFVATWLFFQVRHWSKEAAKKPPTIPHLLPWIGNVESNSVYVMPNRGKSSVWCLG